MSLKNILCIGGNGALGKCVTKALSPHNITNIDFSENPNASTNLIMDTKLTPQKNNLQIVKTIQKQKELFDAIIVTAGSWTGGSIEEENYLEKYDKMVAANVMPCLLAGHLACKYMNALNSQKQKPLIVFTGAAAVFKQPQPTMLAYSLAKTAVHSLAMNLHNKFAEENMATQVLTILPDVIDTPMNREGMPNADFTKWTDPNKIGEMLKAWVEGMNRPSNGSFLLLKQKNGFIQYDSV